MTISQAFIFFEKFNLNFLNESFIYVNNLDDGFQVQVVIFYV